MAGTAKALSAEVRAAIRSGALAGVTAPVVAKQLGLRTNTVWRAAARMGLRFVDARVPSKPKATVPRKAREGREWVGAAAGLRWGEAASLLDGAL